MSVVVAKAIMDLTNVIKKGFRYAPRAIYHGKVGKVDGGGICEYVMKVYSYNGEIVVDVTMNDQYAGGTVPQLSDFTFSVSDDEVLKKAIASAKEDLQSPDDVLWQGGANMGGGVHLDMTLQEGRANEWSFELYPSASPTVYDATDERFFQGCRSTIRLLPR
jgi:hypothetical protein